MGRPRHAGGPGTPRRRAWERPQNRARRIGKCRNPQEQEPTIAYFYPVLLWAADVAGAKGYASFLWAGWSVCGTCPSLAALSDGGAESELQTAKS